MATNRDKFLELRKSGVDPITARKQSYWEIPAIANAPVAWVAPAITPIAPAPTTPIDNKQVLANNQAKVAWEIQAGTRPAVWQQSESLAPPTWTTTPSGATLNADWTVTNAPPVNATANPTTPAPTATPTTATASNTATWAVDFNVWAGREQDIVKNLQTFKTQGMDDNAIKNASGYATADATKKAQIDGFLAGQNKPLDKTTALSGMMAWTPPPVQNTPEYRAAQNTYANFQKFNGMTVPQLVDNLKQGEITTEMNNLLAQNPNYQLAKQEMQAYQNTQNINNAVNGFSSGINGKEIDTPDYLQALSDKILTKLGLSETSAQQAFKDIVTNDSKVVEYTNQLSAINRQVADTTKLLNDGYKDLKAQYGDMPSSALITLMNSRFSTANDTLANLNNSKSYLEADLKNAVEMARGEYEAAAQDIQQNNALRNNVLGQAIWAEFNIATKQIEDEIDRKAKAAALKDPATAIQTVMDEYKKLGIPFTSTIQSRLAEFEASGLPLADYLTQMTQNIQASPAYQKYKSLQEGQLSDKEKSDLWYAQDIANIRLQNELWKTDKAPEWAQDMDGNWYNKNSSVSPWEQVSNGAVDTGWATFFDALWQNVGTYTWNRGIDLAWNIWDPLFAGWDWKVISTDTAWEQKGSIFQPWKWAKPYGNTVVMEDENGNKIRFSHLDSINVKKDDVLWYGTVLWTRGNTWHVLGKNGETLTPEQLAAGRGAHVDIEIMDKNGKLLSEAEQKAYLQSIKQPNPFETTNLSLYRAYAEDGKLPSKDALKGLKMNSQRFIQNADAWYTKFLESQAKEISAEQPTLDIVYNPQKYSAISATQREKLNESVTKIGDIDRRMTRLRELFEENGTETWPTAAKSEMQSLRQQIILKAKEVENLWVLNWPDLWILEDLLPSTTWFWSGVWSFDSNIITKLQSIQSNYRNDAKTKSVNYGAKLIFAEPVEKELAASFPN